MKIYKLLFIIAFSLIILLPICKIDLRNDVVSKIDNVKLPEYNDVKNIEDMEEFISKRIGYRESIINSYISLNDKLFNRMLHPIYTYGENGYVFFKTELEEKDDYYLNYIAQMIKNMQDYVTRKR